MEQRVHIAVAIGWVWLGCGAATQSQVTAQSAQPAAPPAREQAARGVEEAGESPPPLSAGRVAGEVLLGGLVALPGLLVGAYAGNAIDSEDCGSLDDECTGLLIGAYGGAVTAYSVGVYAAGAYGDQTGSLAATLLGGLGSGALGLGLAIAIEDGGAAFLLLPAVGAVVGFNLTRRYDAGRAPALGSLLQLDGDRVTVQVPIPIPSGHAAGRSVLVPVAGGRF